MTTEPYVAVPTAEDLAAVRAASPLAADLVLHCGPFTVPAGVLASTPTLEAGTSEEADVLRQFLADDPWAGMGSVHPGGWMLLARDADTIVLGRREGELGLGKVVTLERRGGRFDARSMGGARLGTQDPVEQVEVLGAARVDVAGVTVEWDCGADDQDLPTARCRRVDVLETDAAVHLILVSVAAPHLRAAADGGYWLAGTGRSTTTTITLRAPLGDRVLHDDSHVPAQVLLPR